MNEGDKKLDSIEVSGHEPSSGNGKSDGVGFSELRNLLLQPEREQLLDAEGRLRKLENRKVDIDADQISAVLPDAVIKRSRQDQRLANALAPTVERTLQVSVRRDPKPIVDAIFPIIGPAIRKSISEALSSTLESINETVEHRFSVKSLKWRFEALRSGRTFSEVVMSHTLLYRIEQIFMIDRETGVPLVHTAAADSVDVQDGSVVSSMLTAIQDFVQDSFGSDEDELLETLEVGDVNVWFETGPRATVAAVIRGLPPKSLRDHLKELVESFHLNYSDDLVAFDGDVDEFESAVPLLEAGLLEQRQESSSRSNWIMWLSLLALGLLVGWLIFSAVTDNRTKRNLVGELDAKEGVVVTNSYSKNGFFYVEGLKDPLSEELTMTVGESGVDPEKVVFNWEPYHTLSPAIVVERARQLLHPSEDVDLTSRDGVVYASGEASTAWIQDARSRAAMLAPSIQYNDAAVVHTEDITIANAIEAIDSLWIGFAFGSSDIPINEIPRIDEVVAHVAQLAEAAAIRDATFVVHLKGGASGNMDDAQNLNLMAQRSLNVRQALLRRGVNNSWLVSSRKDPAELDFQEVERARSVDLLVEIVK